jgi:dihydroxyacetone kinase-like protein
MLDRLLSELDPPKGSRIVPLVNGLGATPLEELFILWRRVGNRLSDAELIPVSPLVGNFVTSMEMSGASLSLMVLDHELETLMAAPAHCPFWRVGS